MYFIYKITNLVNNKIYIGFTSSPKVRWKNHKCCHASHRKLYRAIRKYGKDNFSFEVIYENEDRNHTLTIMEPHFIKLYDSYHNGYNCTEGGDDNNTDEKRERTRHRMRTQNPMKVLRRNAGTFKEGHTCVHSEETKQKIRKAKIGKNNPNFGDPNAGSHLKKMYKTCACGKTTNIGNYTRWHGDNCSRR